MAEVQASGEEPRPDVEIQPYIDAYVERFKQSGEIRSAAVERAFRRVPRHRLVQTFYTADGQEYTRIEHDPSSPDPEHLELIYSHNYLVTRLQDGIATSSSSQPGLMASMLEILEIEAGMRVLEIGAGTGYNAALMAEITGNQARVTTVDAQADVVAQTQRLLDQAGYGGIHVLCADGFYGIPESAPFDRIIVTVGSSELSPHWVAQLASGGRILLPLRHKGANPLVMVSRAEDGAIAGRVVGMSGFMAIQGELEDETYWGVPFPATETPLVQEPGWPELYRPEARRQPYWHGDAWGFWFYLGLRDRRARLVNWMPSFGLADAQTGHWVNLDGEHLTLAGEPALLQSLKAYYDEWRRLGSPGIKDYAITFIPTGHTDEHAGVEDRLAIEGRYYTRIYDLTGESQKSPGA
jgi:protein-L-isoaspartate(D-aspartate) O-methyltransferase